MAAQIVIMSDDLMKVASTVVLCRYIRRIIWINITFSLILKFSAIVLAVMGYIVLWQAVLIDTIAIVFVLSNSVNTYFFKNSIWRDFQMVVGHSDSKERFVKEVLLSVIDTDTVTVDISHNPLHNS